MPREAIIYYPHGKTRKAWVYAAILQHVGVKVTRLVANGSDNIIVEIDGEQLSPDDILAWMRIHKIHED